MTLIGAEFLKLRKRSGIVLTAFGLTVVPALIMLGVTGGGDGDTGGTRAFGDEIGLLASLTLVVGVFVGATLGTADVSSGVFRELVVTGRSRLQLFTARVPAGLALVLAAALAAFVVVVVSALLSAGSAPASTLGGPLGTVAPSAALVAKSAAWFALVPTVGFLLAFGISSLVGSTSGSIATLLALWLVVTPLVESVESLHRLRELLVVSGIDRLAPARLIDSGPGGAVSLGAAIAVVAAWIAVPLAAGAWRTLTREA
jgi:hypothetical protein